MSSEQLASRVRGLPSLAGSHACASRCNLRSRLRALCVALAFSSMAPARAQHRDCISRGQRSASRLANNAPCMLRHVRALHPCCPPGIHLSMQPAVPSHAIAVITLPREPLPCFQHAAALSHAGPAALEPCRTCNKAASGCARRASGRLCCRPTLRPRCPPLRLWT